MPIYRRIDGKWVPQTVYRRINNTWVTQTGNLRIDGNWVNVSAPTYTWEKWTYETITTRTDSDYIIDENGNWSVTYTLPGTYSWNLYADCNVNRNTGEITLSGSATTGTTGGGYSAEGGTVYYYSYSYDPTDGGHFDYIYKTISAKATTTTYSYRYNKLGTNPIGYETSSERHEYPDDGPQNGYYYVFKS